MQLCILFLLVGLANAACEDLIGANENIDLPEITSSSQDAAGALTFEITIPEEYNAGFTLDHLMTDGTTTTDPATLGGSDWTSTACVAGTGYIEEMTEDWDYFFDEPDMLEQYTGATVTYFVGAFQFEGTLDMTDPLAGTVRAGSHSTVRTQAGNLPYRIKFDTQVAVDASLFVSSALFAASMKLESIQVVTGTSDTADATGATANVLIVTSVNPGFKLEHVSSTVSGGSSTIDTDANEDATEGAGTCVAPTDAQLEAGTATACFQYWEFELSNAANPCTMGGPFDIVMDAIHNRATLDGDLIDISGENPALSYSFSLSDLCSVEIDDQEDALTATFEFRDPGNFENPTEEFFIEDDAIYYIEVNNPIVEVASATLDSFVLSAGGAGEDLTDAAYNPGTAVDFDDDACVCGVIDDYTCTCEGDFNIDASIFTVPEDEFSGFTFTATVTVTYAAAAGQMERKLLTIAGPARSLFQNGEPRTQGSAEVAGTMNIGGEDIRVKSVTEVETELVEDEEGGASELATGTALFAVIAFAAVY